MSLIIAAVSRDRAIVAVDTLGYGQATGDFHEFSKLIPIPHANVIVAARGQRMFLIYFHAEINCAMGPVSYDRLLQDVGPIADQVFENTKAQVEGAGFPLIEAELAIVGWSDSEQGFVGMTLVRTQNAVSFECKRMKFGHVAPWSQELGPCELTLDKSAFIAIARRQVEFSKRVFPGQPIGGRLIAAEITKGRMTIESAAELG